MIINIIHDPRRTDRFNLLQKEIREQELDVIYWPAIKATPPKVGIMRAHKQIVLDAKLRNLDMVCIAEDDVQFTCQGAWKYFLGSMPEDFDIYLASVYSGKIDRRTNVVIGFAGLSLYLIKSSFYEKFLSVKEGRHIDMALNGSGKFVVCNPFAAIQHPIKSDNNNGVLNNDQWIGRKNRVLFGGYQNGEAKAITYEQFKILSVTRPEVVQTNS